ncbi:Uncharacterized protein TCM_045493 [Theobroma cacao]|uniref:DUF7356 domain-containing protein n=1 Tax=Theobroma cacao TaxID=3641 RepID=A0A061FS03_THECC|nr:Uncharacterized protein TCM_045493 [Theobroma cacao]
MDSKKILSTFFFFFFTLLTLSRQSRVPSPDSVSPLPSPSPSPLPSRSPAPGPSDAGCWLFSESCRNRSLAACIDPSSSASKELLLLVRNDGEKPLEVKVTVSHAKLLIKNIPIAAHKINKVNVSANLGGNSSILLDAGELKCVIRIRSPASSGGIFDYIPFAAHITRINGAYLLLLTGLIFGSTWACYKRGSRGQQGDGIPYQELEMGQQPDSPSANNVRTFGGWEQEWDGDWDELKSDTAIGHQMANGSGNILTSRPPKRDGETNTWDD